MKQLYKSLVLIFLIATILSCKDKEQYSNIANKAGTGQNNVDWSDARQFYLEHINSSISHLEELERIGAENNKSKEVFINARAEFKKAEPYASYLNPPVGHRVNGPALPIFKEDNLRTMPPVGLQKIEESIYEGGVSESEFLSEVNVTKGLMINLKENIIKRELNAERFFVATHQQLLRIISLSISGFDTPVSHLGFDEAIISLESLHIVYDKSIRSIVKQKNPELDQDFQQSISQAIEFVEKNKDFETFDRYTFIRDYMNPVTRHWVSIRKESGLWEGSDNKPFNFDACPVLI